AESLLEVCLQTGRADLLDQAIDILLQVLANLPDDYDRASLLSCLSVACRRRFERSGARADVEAAVEAGRQAVDATARGGPVYGDRLASLGLALQARFEQFSCAADLNEAVELFRRAVEVTPAEHPGNADRWLLWPVGCSPGSSGMGNRPTWT